MTNPTPKNLDIESLEFDKFSRRIKKIRHKGAPLKHFDKVVEKGKALADKVSYLDEEIKVVEADTANEVVILRSAEPQDSKEAIEYYQLELKPDGETTVERKKYTRKTSDTEKTDFVLTEKMLKRLAKDLDSLSEEDRSKA